MARGYRKVIDQADAVFARGVMIPALGALYGNSRQQGIPLVHWMVGNPAALLESHSRYGPIVDGAGKLFVRNWERELRSSSRQPKTALLCNGEEIARRYPDARTEITVSTTLTRDDLHPERTETCQGEMVNILTVAHVRPEKGVEYLLEALPRLQSARQWHLTVVGSRQRYQAYQEKLDRIAIQNSLTDHLSWAGHADRGTIAAHLKQADVFVLPTLSEGTPRVLLEAQAFGVPLVASRVGGIPTAVTHEKNGLLVPAKDPRALAMALDRIIQDEDLRKGLIACGHRFAAEHTLDRFALQVNTLLEDLRGG
jgi:glycosyltransferase involved in cell wall biosynthesis